MRNCFRLMDEKNRKMVSPQLKEIYNSINEAQAKQRLEDFAAYWNDKYDAIIHLCEKDWTELMACMHSAPL